MTAPGGGGANEIRDRLAGRLFDFTMRRNSNPVRWADRLGVTDDSGDELLRDETVRDAWRLEADRLFEDVIAAEVEARVQAAEDRHVGIVREATDLCWKATPYTQDEGGFVAAYLLPAGVVHRLLGQLQGAGYPAAFRALAPVPDDADGGERR